MINLSNALSIDGWMSSRELEWLASKAIQSTKILEIGSYKGRSTRALTDNTKGIVDIVDPFKGRYFSNDFKNVIFDADDALFNIFLKNMRGLDNLIINRVPFRDFKTAFKYDLIFIDGDHHINEVQHDIDKGLKLLKSNSNAIISGHDYNVRDWPGVKEVVDRVFGDLVKVEDTIWYVQL